jgi:magnesium-transporting ATPase (P-type)
MSAIVSIDNGSGFNDQMVLCKGAPEIIKKILHEVPEGFDRCYLPFVKNGARVLALAYKILPRLASKVD